MSWPRNICQNMDTNGGGERAECTHRLERKSFSAEFVAELTNNSLMWVDCDGDGESHSSPGGKSRTGKTHGRSALGAASKQTISDSGRSTGTQASSARFTITSRVILTSSRTPMILTKTKKSRWPWKWVPAMAHRPRNRMRLRRRIKTRGPWR